MMGIGCTHGGSGNEYDENVPSLGGQIKRPTKFKCIPLWLLQQAAFTDAKTTLTREAACLYSVILISQTSRHHDSAQQSTFMMPIRYSA